MALTKAQVREILSAAGIDTEKMSEAVNKIIDGHTASIEALREERDTYKDKVAKYDELVSENAKLKDEAAKNADKDYDALKKEFDDYKTDIENKATRAKKEDAYKAILKDAGIADRHFAKILKYSDIDAIELDENGKAKDSKAIMKSIKDEWGDHVDKQSTVGASTATPPAGGAKGGSVKTKDEIMQIKDTTERQEALKEYLMAQNN